MTTKLDDIVLKRNIGRNAPDLICQLATGGIIASLEEFITNAHDADAEHVSLFYNEKKDTLIIEDDGTGMDLRDLQGFYRLGDSQKAEKPVTAKGRKCIGKFGIATILLKSLAREYALETFKDGSRITVDESFNGQLSSEHPIPYKVSDAPKGKHGTKLTLRGLTFNEGDGKFALKDFIKRLQWDMPIRPDFEVTVNDTQIASKRVTNAEEYQFNEEHASYGHAHGTFYLTKRPTPDAGVHIYVNGRRVGDSKALMRHVKNAASRIVGVVHADGLERAILFDRGRFKEDHKGVVELNSALRKFVGKIDNEISREQDRRRFKRAVVESTETLADVAHALNQKLEPFSAKGNAVGIEFAKIDDGIASVYDPAEKRIRLNSALPQFSITDSFNLDHYRAAIADASIDALVAHKVGARASIAQFLRTKQEYVRQLYAQSGKLQKQPTQLSAPAPRPAVAPAQRPLLPPLIPVSPRDSFSDIKMYEAADIASNSGLLLGTVNRLQESGALPASHEKSNGKDVKTVLDRIRGYTSLHQILHGIEQPSSLTMRYNTVTDHFKELTDNVPYIKDFGAKKPCFFVQNEFVPQTAKALKKRITRAQLRDNLMNATDIYLAIPALAKVLHAPEEDIKRMLNYSTQNELHLPIKSTEGTPTYHYFYARQNLDSMRTGKVVSGARDMSVPED